MWRSSFVGYDGGSWCGIPVGFIYLGVKEFVNYWGVDGGGNS